MWLFLNNDDDITGFLSRVLISFTVESVLAIIRGTFVNLGFENFLFFGYLFAFADFAFVGFINDFTFTTAIVARSLRL